MLETKLSGKISEWRMTEDTLVHFGDDAAQFEFGRKEIDPIHQRIDLAFALGHC